MKVLNAAQQKTDRSEQFSIGALTPPSIVEAPESDPNRMDVGFQVEDHKIKAVMSALAKTPLFGAANQFVMRGFTTPETDLTEYTASKLTGHTPETIDHWTEDQVTAQEQRDSTATSKAEKRELLKLLKAGTALTPEQKAKLKAPKLSKAAAKLRDQEHRKVKAAERESATAEQIKLDVVEQTQKRVEKAAVEKANRDQLAEEQAPAKAKALEDGLKKSECNAKRKAKAKAKNLVMKKREAEKSRASWLVQIDSHIYEEATEMYLDWQTDPARDATPPSEETVAKKEAVELAVAGKAEIVRPEPITKSTVSVQEKSRVKKARKAEAAKLEAMLLNDGVKPAVKPIVEKVVATPPVNPVATSTKKKAVKKTKAKAKSPAKVAKTDDVVVSTVTDHRKGSTSNGQVLQRIEPAALADALQRGTNPPMTSLLPEGQIEITVQQLDIDGIMRTYNVAGVPVKGTLAAEAITRLALEKTFHSQRARRSPDANAAAEQAEREQFKVELPEGITHIASHPKHKDFVEKVIAENTPVNDDHIMGPPAPKAEDIMESSFSAGDPKSIEREAADIEANAEAAFNASYGDPEDAVDMHPSTPRERFDERKAKGQTAVSSVQVDSNARAAALKISTGRSETPEVTGGASHTVNKIEQAVVSMEMDETLAELNQPVVVTAPVIDIPTTIKTGSRGSTAAPVYIPIDKADLVSDYMTEVKDYTLNRIMLRLASETIDNWKKRVIRSELRRREQMHFNVIEEKIALEELAEMQCEIIVETDVKLDRYKRVISSACAKAARRGVIVTAERQQAAFKEELRSSEWAITANHDEALERSPTGFKIHQSGTVHPPSATESLLFKLTGRMTIKAKRELDVIGTHIDDASKRPTPLDAVLANVMWHCRQLDDPASHRSIRIEKTRYLAYLKEHDKENMALRVAYVAPPRKEVEVVAPTFLEARLTRLSTQVADGNDPRNNSIKPTKAPVPVTEKSSIVQDILDAVPTKATYGWLISVAEATKASPKKFISHFKTSTSGIMVPHVKDE